MVLRMRNKEPSVMMNVEEVMRSVCCPRLGDERRDFR